jgi:hypothetical protein
MAEDRELTPSSEPESESERESFTDADRDFPFPHENRSWITGVKRKTTDLKFTSDSLPIKPETKPKPKHKHKRMVGSGPSPTREEQERSELLRFMSESLRKEYKDADLDRQKVIWEANKQAYEAAKKRKDEQFHREKKRTADILDMLHRVKEDPSKHNLLPPENASMDDLGKWYDDMQKPVRTVPFPGVVDPPERYLEFRTGAHGRPEVRLHPEPPSAEELALRKREELLNREEELQRRRERPKPFDVIPKVSLWPGDDEEHARKMQRAFENKTTIHSSPFWAVLGFLRRWTALGGVFLLGATWTMIQIDEFALAAILLLLGTFAFSVQIYDWKGIEEHRTATRILKGLAGLLIVGSFVFFGAVILKKKSEKSWSNLLVKETRPEISKLYRPSPSPAATPTTDTNPVKEEKPPSLVDLFKNDFPNVMKAFDENRVGVQFQNGEVVHIATQVYLDFPAKTQFVGFYIPASGKTVAASLQLVNGVHDAMDWLRKNQTLRAGYRGETTTLDELVFSGRVFLYHEDFLSITDKANIIKAYKQKHYDVQFRGPEYLDDQIITWHQQHDSKN